MKKKLLLILIPVVILVALVATALIKPELAYRAKMMLTMRMNSDTDINYLYQNYVFSDSHEGTYVPYDEYTPNPLQIRANAYYRATGKRITQQDVKDFLKTGKNPDGSARTYEDDETGKIRDFVVWCILHADEIRSYRARLSILLAEYNQKYPDSQSYALHKLDLRQINEFDRQLDDPSYQPRLQVE